MRRFHKLHGLGNDFMLVDARQSPWTPDPSTIAALADRHEGIGFDQLLILDTPAERAADVACRIYNLDGSAAQQCLNGVRCIARYLADTSPGPVEWRIAAPAGQVIGARLQGKGVELSLPLPRLLDTAPCDIDVPGRRLSVWRVDAGNLHAIAFGHEPREARARFGRAVSVHPSFADGANAGFARFAGDGEIELAVFERGSGPTRACGSAAAAAAVAARAQTARRGPWTVRQPGGVLVIDWDAAGETLVQRGPAVHVFQGELIEQRFR